MTHSHAPRRADRTALAGLSALTAPERERLEHRLVEFDRDWRAGAFAAAVGLLPRVRWWAAAVVEMVKIDLERRWQAGDSPTLDEYRAIVPELAGPDDVPVDLLAAEFRLRREFGGAADLAAYAAAYPAQAAALRHLIDESGETAALSGTAFAPYGGGATLPLPSLEPGTSFGRYGILRPLGRGAMGSVYLAHDPTLERDVAFKIPSDELNEDPQAAEWVLREARAAAGLHHPNICPVYDVGEISGVPFITSRYIEGESLAAVLRRSSGLPEGEVARLVAIVARALAFAHHLGVVHRDLKPANIMLESDGQPIVMDFGLARRARPGQTADASLRGPVGTPAYMAPEQVGGKTGRASDIFSLGVVLYEMLTGRVPFLGTVPEVMAQIESDDAPPPSAFRPALDPRLEAVCLRAIARDQRERYPSMTEFAEALDAVIGAKRPWVNRRRLAWVGAALAALVFVGIFAVSREKTEVGSVSSGNGNRPDEGVIPPIVIPPIAPPFRTAAERVKGFEKDVFARRPAFKGVQLRDGRPNLPIPTTAAEWVDVLTKCKVDDRMLAIGELARRGHTAAIEDLITKLKTEPPTTHWSERRECAAALAHLGGRGNNAVAEALVKRVADKWWLRPTGNQKDPWRNPFGAEYRDPEHGGKDAALEALREVAPELVVSALRLALRQTKTAEQSLLELPEGACGQPYLIRAWAAERLAAYDTPETAALLAGSLNDPNGLVRRRAAESLAKLTNARAAADALAKRVADGTWRAERYATLLGEKFGSGYPDPEWGGKTAALDALRKAAPERVETALHAALVQMVESPGVEDERSYDPSVVRAWAAERLVAFDTPETVAALAKALNDPTGLVRKRAAESLAKLKRAGAAADALADRVADDTWMGKVFTTLTGEPFPSEYADPEWGGKDDALQALAKVSSSKRVIAALQKAEESSTPEVKAWAKRELEKQQK